MIDFARAPPSLPLHQSPARLPRIAARLYASTKSPEAMTRLFALWDPAGLGVITQAAFRRIFPSLPLVPLAPATQVDALVAFADPTESGSVNYKVFCDKLFVEYEKAVKVTGKEF